MFFFLAFRLELFMENLWRCSTKRFIIWLYSTRLLFCRAWHLAKPFLVALWSVKLEPPVKSIVSPLRDVVFCTFQTFFLYDSFDKLSRAYKIPTNVFHLTMLLILRHKFLLVVNLHPFFFFFLVLILSCGSWLWQFELYIKVDFSGLGDFADFSRKGKWSNSNWIEKETIMLGATFLIMDWILPCHAGKVIAILHVILL